MEIYAVLAVYVASHLRDKLTNEQQGDAGSAD